MGLHFYPCGIMHPPGHSSVWTAGLNVEYIYHCCGKCKYVNNLFFSAPLPFSLPRRRPRERGLLEQGEPGGGVLHPHRHAQPLRVKIMQTNRDLFLWEGNDS